ncbi:beta-ketoacyl synthase N-terminal-like domain-containing protein [Apilactobacillus quenuiae]|uniref:beta-ketoacyl synthase N-terminal-like domain-containing protein n=1 Tax=Apilactobacillus quenuiae TaxID=2008377 RepID=UPI000D014282|nr:beta-ketoacyl synthase N-terminal-like domain-containing protein [Apilactobacillus quenuiae]
MKIAIIGCSYELPEVNNDKDLTDIFNNGQDTIKRFNKQRKSNNINCCYLLNDYKNFDAEYFGFSDSEIKNMDPQHRRFLVNVWKLITEYGLRNNSSLLKETGVFSAMSASDYLMKNISSNDNLSYSTYLNNIPDTAASKTSYKFGFGGISANISSACSSFASALYYACEDLKANRLKMAIVGGAHIIANAENGYKYIPDSIFSKAGTCRPFDNDADGMVPGNGVVVIALKTLKDAQKAHDQILCTINGIGVSNDGDTKSGYAAPGVTGQLKAINTAYQSAGIDKHTIDYLELHGTGTKIGDAIEATSLKQAFPSQPLVVGSTKANFGHLDTISAGLGLLKAIWMLNKQIIPKQANFSQLSEIIKQINPGIKVMTNSMPKKIQTIGINSFGMGGTNAHIIVTQYKSPKSPYLKQQYQYNVPIFSKRLSQHEQHIKRVESFIHDTQTVTSLMGGLHNLLFRSVQQAHLSWLQVSYSNELGHFKVNTKLLNQEDNYDLTTEKRAHLELKKFPLIKMPSEPLMEKKLWLEPKVVAKSEPNSKTIEDIFKIFETYCTNEHNIDLKNCKLKNLPIDSFLLVELVENLNQVTQKQYKLTDLLVSDETVMSFCKSLIQDQTSIQSTNTSGNTENTDSQVSLPERILRANKQYGLHISIDEVNNSDLLESVIQTHLQNKKTFNFITYLNDFYGSRPNLFLIHPAGGTTMGYQHMFQDKYYPYNIILIDFPFTHLEYVKQYDLKQLAQLYKNAIELINKDQPFVLGGYSFGGNITFEIAKQLVEQKSIKPQLLIMLDTHPIEAYADNVPISKAAQHIMQSQILKNVQHIGAEDKKTFLTTWKINHQMLKTYQSTAKLNLPMKIFICKEQENTELLRQLHIKYLDKRKWQRRFQQPIQAIYVNGNHYSIYMNHKLGKQLGNMIDQLLIDAFKS